MLKIIKKIFLISLFIVFTNCEQASQNKNSSNNIVIIKVFSSLTCPHCADFHGTVYEKLKKEYMSVGKIKFEHYGFPLDLSALNAEKILQCSDSSQINMDLLTELYKKQSIWTAGSEIKVINEKIKKISKNFNLTDNQMDKCLLDKNLEEKILNKRIEAQKNYKVRSTPTIFLNKKKYEGKRDYKSFKKAVDRLL